METLIALLIALAVLYGLGLPIAWLLPAPSNAQWVFRIAIAPLLGMTLTSAAAWLLSWIGASLHPGQLVVAAALLWAVAVRRSRGAMGWQARDAVLPASMMSLAGLLWYVSLRGYGLYLPNRDFKNHAYWVAVIADTRNADPSQVLKPSPISPPVEGGFYPLGLHTMLGWSLPDEQWNALGITAASAVVCASVSLPLAGITLARLWDGNSRPLWVITGFALSAFPAMTSAFSIGSVTIICAGALYAAALASAWMWLRAPGIGETVGLALAGLGLVLLHVAEAWGLLLVVATGLLVVRERGGRRLSRRTWLLAALAGGATMVASLVVLRPILGTLSSGFNDIQPNDQSVALSLFRAVLSQPGGNSLITLIWLALAIAGAWLGLRAGLSRFPIVAIAVPLLLGLFASTRGVPAALNLLTAPWYGADSRVYLMTGPPIALMGSLALARSVEAVARQAAGGSALPVRLVAGTVAVVVVAVGMPVLEQRRSDLAATLTGAGDVATVAASLNDDLGDGQTVMNFEGDGTANLYAAARVPVTVGTAEPDLDLGPGRDYGWLQSALMRVDSPPVRDALEQLRVRFIVLGTGSLYWDPQVGYDVDGLLDQEELTLHTVGTDMVVLEYRSRP